jgi:hypothetical protein
MRQPANVRAIICTFLSFGIACPQWAFAFETVKSPASLKPGSSYTIPVDPQISDVALASNGKLRGVLLTAQGNPVANSPVVFAQSGKLVAQTETNREGEFEVTGMEPGIYQIASYAKSQNVRIWDASQANPVGTKKGIVHVMPEELIRGNAFDGTGPLMTALTNPLLIAGLAAASVAIAIAVVQDDDDAS